MSWMISGSWAGPQIGDSSTTVADAVVELVERTIALGYGRRDWLIGIGIAGRRKIRIALIVNSALALSTTRLHPSYYRSKVRQRIHFGFGGGLRGRRCSILYPLDAAEKAALVRPGIFQVLQLVALHRGFDELIVAGTQGWQRLGIDQHLDAPGYAGLASDQRVAFEREHH